MSVPASRIRPLSSASVRRDGELVLYWMIAARRGQFNFGLERAVELARELSRPLVILEALRVAYPWASERLHAFVLEGMRDNQRHFATKAALYYPYVEPSPGAGRGLLSALAQRACAVITDEYPCFFLPRMVESARAQVPVRFEAIDSNGLLPLSFAEGRSFATAYAFRRFLQNSLERALAHQPQPDPLRRVRLPDVAHGLRDVLQRYPPAQLERVDTLVAELPLDHAVKPSPVLRGGHAAATARLRAFVQSGLDRYAQERNHPDAQATSGLSPYLHFGHIGTHEIFRALAEQERWDGLASADRRSGTREGFWGLSPNTEAFLDQLITWRELAFNTAANMPDFDRYVSLPGWAQTTLRAHRADARPQLYTFEQLERAETHDPVWNAAQTELLREGRLHNYLRMLWGKKILQWSESPERALERMIQLNDRYAIDGRDPNSYAGIFWTLGRYDRPWGPERAIFGTVRYMSSEAARKKLKMRAYLARYS